MKKILLIFIPIILVASIGAGVWYFITQKNISGGEQETSGRFRNLFPFGGEETGISGTETETGNEPRNTGGGEDFQSGETNGPFRTLAAEQVAGFSVFEDSKDGPFVLYAERETGHVWMSFLSSPSKERQSNTTIPRLNEALFLDQKHIIFRYLDEDDRTIQTFVGVIASSTSSNPDENRIGKIRGVYLPKNILSVTKNPKDASFFYIQKDASGSSGFLSDSEGRKQTKIFSSPVSEWLASWPSDNRILLITRPSSRAEGFIFSLNPKTAAFSKLVGAVGIFGVGNTSGNIFVSKNDERTPTTLIFDPATSAEFPLVAKTLSEKCVWSKKDKEVVLCAVPENISPGNYPDEWYQGTKLFSDRLWRINTKSEEATLIANLSEYGSYDIDLLSLTKNEDYVVFRDKSTQNLLSLKLEK